MRAQRYRSKQVGQQLMFRVYDRPSEDNLLNISGIQYLYEIRNSSENSNRSRKQDGKRSELSKKP
jgi:hypothetical protein